MMPSKRQGNEFELISPGEEAMIFYDLDLPAPQGHSKFPHPHWLEREGRMRGIAWDIFWARSGCGVHYVPGILFTRAQLHGPILRPGSLGNIAPN